MDKLPIETIDTVDGIEPEFTLVDMQKIKAAAAESTETQRYYVDAYLFVDNYRRKELPWKIMTRRQREWLWKIKDDLDKRRGR